MTVAVWRVSETTFDVDGFLCRFPALNPDAVWRKGEARSGGRVSINSGFNKTLFEVTSPSAVSEHVEKALLQYRDPAEALFALGVTSMLDVGVMVGGQHSFTASVSIDAKALQVLATLKIGLTVSAYPVSDEGE